MTPTAYPNVSHSRELTGEQKKTLRRAIVASSLGNASEWYDYGIYALLVIPLGHAFFPESSPAVQVLSTFAIFALSFLLRPLGGIVLGPLGDRLGRQRVLVFSIMLMAGATTLIGVLPTHASIGIFAPALLLILRLIQGFSTGGEYGGAATFMAEYSPSKQRGFYGSFLEFGTTIGTVLGLAVVAICQYSLGDDAMAAWGWRIPFLLAAPLGLIGLYVRLKLDDTPVFREAKDLGQVHQKVSSQARVCAPPGARSLCLSAWC